jgi:hypothetical protein
MSLPTPEKPKRNFNRLGERRLARRRSCATVLSFILSPPRRSYLAEPPLWPSESLLGCGVEHCVLAFLHLDNDGELGLQSRSYFKREREQVQTLYVESPCAPHFVTTLTRYQIRSTVASSNCHSNTGVMSMQARQGSATESFLGGRVAGMLRYAHSQFLSDRSYCRYVGSQRCREVFCWSSVLLAIQT